jgi:hypothetical protein
VCDDQASRLFKGKNGFTRVKYCMLLCYDDITAHRARGPRIQRLLFSSSQNSGFSPTDTQMHPSNRSQAAHQGDGGDGRARLIGIG